jgi:Pyridoxamine 5'-phosphate oxidase
MTWRDLEAAAPELARLGAERLDAAGIALLGTLRRSGAPRISPVEPFLVSGQLLFGVMAWSGKARDLARDPRCVVHSAVSSPDAGVGELKLYGRAVLVDDPELRASPARAWWVGRPAGEAPVFSLAVDEAVFVSWDLGRGRVTLRSWKPERGLSETTRDYP